MNIRYYEGKRIYFRPLELDDEPQLRPVAQRSGELGHAKERRPYECPART